MQRGYYAKPFYAKWVQSKSKVLSWKKLKKVYKQRVRRTKWQRRSLCIVKETTNKKKVADGMDDNTGVDYYEEFQGEVMTEAPGDRIRTRNIQGGNSNSNKNNPLREKKGSCEWRCFNWCGKNGLKSADCKFKDNGPHHYVFYATDLNTLHWSCKIICHMTRWSGDQCAFRHPLHLIKDVATKIIDNNF